MSNHTKPILVIGATGSIGGAVVSDLLKKALPVRALLRSPDEANLPQAVDIYRGDLTDPASLDHALDGVGAVFLLWTAPPASVADVIERISQRAQHIVFLSSPHKTQHPFFQQSRDNPMRALHEHIERTISETGMRSTIIRPGMFASNALHWWAPSIRAGAPIRWPHATAETAPIDERDVAAVAAHVLSFDDHEGGDYVLTGPESLSQSDQVRIIGAVIGRPIAFEEVSPEEFRHTTASSWPPPIVDMLLAAWKAAVDRPAFVTSSVFDITGVPPRSFRDWVGDHADAFLKE